MNFVIWVAAIGFVLAGFLGIRNGVFGFAPGAFLLFGLSFARPDYRKYILRWKFIVAAVFLLPGFAWFPNRIFYSLVLVSAVLILTNLEKTLRASTGHIRWQIKFIVLSVAIICATWIYLGSQVLIYSELDASLPVLNAVALILACFFFGWGIIRSNYLRVDVYLSRATIQHTLTGMLVSIYLVSIGIIAYFVRTFDLDRFIALDALLILVALAVLAMLLLSDRLRERIQRFVTRHFKRPVYDYRKAWMDLTEKTNSLVEIHELSTAIARIISQTFGILSVNVWLCDEAKEKLSLAGSTVFSRQQAQALERHNIVVTQLLREVEGRTALDLNKKMFQWAEDIMCAEPKSFVEYKMRYILPLQTGGQLVGILTLNDDRVGKAPLSLEDQDLLHAYASHFAARVLQLRLSESLRKTQEMEAFKNVSAFFVHDLKNVASRLSLTMQNLPAYFDNPEFRNDALKLIGESAAKIDSTISRLSLLKQIEIKPIQTDLNALIEMTLNEYERSTKRKVERVFGELPKISLDPEQIQKVITNLVMNAHDATRNSIQIATSMSDHHAMFIVTDDGCGMSREFIDKTLFRPFHSTKKSGMGIGLFHSKMIVEAHHGRIEVESEEGKGATFRVLLPI